MMTKVMVGGVIVAIGAGIALADRIAPASGQRVYPDPAPFARPNDVPFPPDNPYSPAKAALGEQLFHDTRLSGDGSRSCATCHDAAKGWEDGRATGQALDGSALGRRVPTIANAAWGEQFFWDGRAPTLEDQALGPVQNPREMNQTLDALVTSLGKDASYQTAFAAAFPETPEITAPTIAAALATFERTVVSDPAPFDAWAGGNDLAISEAAKRGFALFVGTARCASCHSGWTFSDNGFHDIGLPGDDAGRGPILELPDLNHAFKTPSLRDLTLRGPYMHDGSLATLDAVIEHYASGTVQRETLSPDLLDIELTASEKAEIVAFLRSLSADRPARPHSAVTAFTPAPLPAVTQAEVSQRNKAFTPGHVNLTIGQTLLIHNEDTRDHNIRIHDPLLEWNSGLQEPGQSVQVTPQAEGTYYAFCGVHPGMKLVIDVTAR